MSAAFWSNTIWFVLLGVSTVIELSFVFYKAKDKIHIIALFLSIAGVTFSVEVIIFCFLRGYDYYPMIIPQSPIDDGLAGNLFSQFSITSTALLIGVLDLKYYWSFVFAATYGIIEELFLKLSIYSHNWYKTWITILGLTVLFGTVKKTFKNKSIFTGHISRYILMFFALYTLHMIIIWWPFLLSGIVGINKKIFSDPLTSYTFISFLNLFVLSMACMIIFFLTSKWLYKSIVISALYFALYFAEGINIISIKEGWFLPAATMDIWGMYLFVYTVNELYNKIGTEVNY